jgi:hypothetical protein
MSMGTSETLEVILKITATGDAKSKMDDLAKGTKVLQSEEEKLQQKVVARMRKMHEASRIQEEMIRVGLQKGPATEEEKYQKLLERRLGLLQQNKRIQEDLVKLGAKAGPKSQQQEFHEAYERKIKDMEKRSYIEQKMIESGHKEDPEIVRMEKERKKSLQMEERASARESAAEARIRAKDDAALGRHLGKQEEYGQQKQMKTFLAGLAGRPLEAGLSAMIPSGAGHAAKLNLAMAVITAGKAIMTTTGQFVNINNNTTMTGQEQNRAMGRAVGFGDFIDAYDAIDGTTEHIRKVEEESHPLAMAKMEGETRMYRETYPIRQEERRLDQSASMLNRQIGSGAAAANNWKMVDRSTVGGEREYEQEKLRYRTSIDKERAENALSLAKGDRGFALKEAKERESLANEAMKRFQNLHAKARLEVNPGSRNELLKDAEAANTEMMKRQEEYQQRILEAKQAGVRVAEAESQLRQVSINHQRQELNLLKEKESRIASSARTLGGMNEGDKQASVAALKEIQKAGRVDAVPPEMLAMAQRVAPNFIGKLMDEQGERDRQRFGIGQIEGDPESLRDVRAEIQQKDVKVEVAVNLDAKEVANQLSANIKGLVAEITTSISKEMQAEFARIRIGNEQRYATAK